MIFIIICSFSGGCFRHSKNYILQIQSEQTGSIVWQWSGNLLSNISYLLFFCVFMFFLDLRRLTDFIVSFPLVWLMFAVIHSQFAFYRYWHIDNQKTIELLRAQLERDLQKRSRLWSHPSFPSVPEVTESQRSSVFSANEAFKCSFI